MDEGLCLGVAPQSQQTYPVSLLFRQAVKTLFDWCGRNELDVDPEIARLTELEQGEAAHRSALNDKRWSS